MLLFTNTSWFFLLMKQQTDIGSVYLKSACCECSCSLINSDCRSFRCISRQQNTLLNSQANLPHGHKHISTKEYLNHFVTFKVSVLQLFQQDASLCGINNKCHKERQNVLDTVKRITTEFNITFVRSLSFTASTIWDSSNSPCEHDQTVLL